MHSSDALEVLANAPEPSVRAAPASNPSCPESLVWKMVSDKDVGVRHGKAQNISTQHRLLKILAEDENGWVRGEAIRTLEILPHIIVVDEVARRRTQSRKVRSRARKFNQIKQDKATG